MKPERERRSLGGVLAGWLAIACSFAGAAVLDHRLSAAERLDLVVPLWSPVAAAFITAILSAAVVGSALILRRPRHPVGWLFLALAVAVSSSGILDGYTAYGAVARPGTLPLAGFVATLADLAFVPWLMLLALILLLTPSGRLATRAARLAAVAAMLGGFLTFGAGLFRPYHGEYASFGVVENPLAREDLAGVLAAVGITGVVVLHAGLLTAVALLVLRFRGSRNVAGRPLRWLALAAIPFPILVLGAWVASLAGNEYVLALSACGFLVVIPVAAGLAIEQDHLYDVDRLISRGLSYSLLTAGLVGCYTAIVVVAGEVLGDFGGDSQALAVVATLVTVSIALPARRRLQEALDRRFNRRQFEAVTAIRRFVRAPSPSTTIERALRDALRVGNLRIAYWIDERAIWVDEWGTPAAVEPNAMVAERHGAKVAAVRYDGAAADRRTVERVVAEALPELENARLRAAIALQLVEVRESRARIVAAQVAERRKLERNLHDGAQQRLLAIALELRAAEVSEDPPSMQAAINAAVHQLQLAVGDLRSLANGLHPAVLVDGGLAAAFDDLAARIPVAVRLDATPARFAPPIEEAAWYIVCEAVTNAVKHGRPRLIGIRACAGEGRLSVVVEDDGNGGADPRGTGLRGIADRAEAAGGSLKVHERPGGGTIITAELPCAL